MGDNPHPYLLPWPLHILNVEQRCLLSFLLLSVFCLFICRHAFFFPLLSITIPCTHIYLHEVSKGRSNISGNSSCLPNFNLAIIVFFILSLRSLVFLKASYHYYYPISYLQYLTCMKSNNISYLWTLFTPSFIKTHVEWHVQLFGLLSRVWCFIETIVLKEFFQKAPETKCAQLK